LGFEHRYQNQQKTLSLGLGEENAARIRAQNQRQISVIIGNPPYNANQQNENDNNKNRSYLEIDEAIKRTYIANSTAQKTKVYDMYARFFRWASNRLADNGILAFVTNSSFLESRTFDGFRKVVAEEFNDIYIVDLGGDVRKNPKLSGTKNNVFGIQTGVAISFLVKRQGATSCQISYVRRPEMEIAAEKLAFLRHSNLKQIEFDRIMPDKNHNWLNIADNDFEQLLPLANNETKRAKSQVEARAVFKLFSNGVVTARDEWVYDVDKDNLLKKVDYFCRIYEKEKLRWEQSAQKTSLNDFVDRTIKWASELEAHLKKGSILEFDSRFLRYSFYRPFIKKYLYFNKIIIHRLYQQGELFKFGEANKLICFSGLSSTKPFQCLVTVAGLDFLEKTQCLPFYRYDAEGNRLGNLTDWGLNQFRSHYQDNTITKEDIFHYTYAVLHHPAYREKYAFNLTREFPRLPFYDEFHQWVAWGKQLMELHLNSVEKYPLKRVDKSLATHKLNKPKLKADKDAGKIQLDEITLLQGIPPQAWEYQLGNRCALEWILDQYKEKKPKDKTLAEKFNAYRFADYKEHVIDLLLRVCTVSVETRRIIGKMP
jgi:predicted helicase